MELLVLVRGVGRSGWLMPIAMTILTVARKRRVRKQGRRQSGWERRQWIQRTRGCRLRKRNNQVIVPIQLDNAGSLLLSTAFPFKERCSFFAMERHPDAGRTCLIVLVRECVRILEIWRVVIAGSFSQRINLAIINITVDIHICNRSQIYIKPVNKYQRWRHGCASSFRPDERDRDGGAARVDGRAAGTRHRKDHGIDDACEDDAS